MGRQNLAFLAFNRGLVDPRGLARADIKRLALSAALFNNFTPRVLGSMMMRAGLAYTGATRNNNKPFNIPFVFAIGDTANLELTDQNLRIWISDVLLTRVSVATQMLADFNVGPASPPVFWTDNSDAGATTPQTLIVDGVMRAEFVSNGTARSSIYSHVFVAVADRNKEHALRIKVYNGPITLRVGTSGGDDSYINEVSLGTGEHSLALTPTGDFYVQFSSILARKVHVTSIQVEAAGVVSLPAPWLEADLGKVRYDQSGDVIFCAAYGYQQRKIERHAARSWSVVLYLPEDGPFLTENTTTKTMAVSALTGNVTLTASTAHFTPSNVGSLFTLDSIGQTVTKTMALLNDMTAAIRVTGIGTDRSFTISLTGFTAGRQIALERSFDNAIWTVHTNYNADTTVAVNDFLDNQIVYYRLDLTVVGAAGNTSAYLSIATGTITGVGRITAYTSATQASLEVLKDFGSTTATKVWSEGQWSTRRGWPSSVGFAEGRLWWAGKDKVNGSISDAFDGFDPKFEGDAGPILRSIGSGPVDTINWLLSLQRLMLGGQESEFSCRSSALDEPLTPTNFNMKRPSSQGSGSVAAVKVDSAGIMVQRGGTRVFQLTYAADQYDYSSVHLSAVVPRIGVPGIVRMAVQRQPDTRVHFVRSDGTVAILVFDQVENVICWITADSTGAGGFIEDAMVLPGDVGSEEDQVYYWVRRTVNGATVRYREKFALETECVGGTLNKQADSFVVFTNTPPSSTVTGLTHLIGQQVVVWADGKCMDDGNGNPVLFTVDGTGAISLTDNGAEYIATTGIAGLYYKAQWQSGKLLELRSMLGTALLGQEIIKGLGLILWNTHARGLKFGRTFDAADLDDMPSIERGAAVDPDYIWTAYDEPSFVFPGGWSTDERLCLQAEAPKPATALAIMAEAELHE